MDVPTLHVHSHSDKGTIAYVTFMWETMRSLANHPEALKLTVHCMGPSAVDQLAKLPNSQVFLVPMPDLSVQGGSMAHGVSIEQALAMTDDGDIHLNVDSDTVVLAKGWDDYVRIQLLDKGTGIMGVTFEDIGGFSSGHSSSQTFKKIPYTAWLAMSPKHEWRHLKVRPEKGVDIPVRTPEQSQMYNLPVGYTVLRDVGWQIPQYLHDNNISYVGWKHLKGSKDATVLKGLSDYHEEFHVEDGIPFVVHHRGSLRHVYRGSDLSTKFYNAVDAYLVQEKQREPRWQWEPNDANAPVLALMREQAENAKERVAKTVEEVKAAEPPTAQATAATGATLGGWLKATLDGRGVWNRYTQPVPSVINIVFTPELEGKHLRLEGSVSGVTVTLPAAPNRPHWMTARNLTAGDATLRTDGGAKVITVPPGVCWQILVDVDGVVHVE